MTTDESALYRCPQCGTVHEYAIRRGPDAASTSRWMHKPCLDAGHPATMEPVQVRDATGWRPVKPGERTKRDGWALLPG